MVDSADEFRAPNTPASWSRRMRDTDTPAHVIFDVVSVEGGKQPLLTAKARGDNFNIVVRAYGWDALHVEILAAVRACFPEGAPEALIAILDAPKIANEMGR